MMSEELILACEKLTAEWVHVKICRPMCDILNAFDKRCFDILDEFCNDPNIENLKYQLRQNIQHSFEQLDALEKIMEEKEALCPQDASDVKEAMILPFDYFFPEMKSNLYCAQRYVGAYSEIADKGYGFGENENVNFARESLQKGLEEYRNLRKEKGYA
jgi:hypothetical protein